MGEEREETRLLVGWWYANAVYHPFDFLAFTYLRGVREGGLAVIHGLNLWTGMRRMAAGEVDYGWSYTMGDEKIRVG